MSSSISNIYITQNVTLITLTNVPYDIKTKAEIFSSLAEADINIDMISQTSPLKNDINISFSLMDSDLFNAIQVLKTFKSSISNLRIEVNSNNTKVGLFSEEMRNTPGIFAETLNIFANANIEIKMITTSEVEIAYLIYSSDENKALNLLKSKYNL
ncbi:MAG: ACT domain-containing protein [Eubacteriales bacterium]